MRPTVPFNGSSGGGLEAVASSPNRASWSAVDHRDEPVDVSTQLARVAVDHPDRPALVDHLGTVTYAELDARVDAGVAALQSLGVRRGDRVALIDSSTTTFIEVWAAVLRAAAVVVPLMPDLAPDELRHAIVDSGARVAIVGPDRCDALLSISRAEVSGLTVVATTQGPTDVTTWAELCSAAPSPAKVELEPTAPAALMYTSGTTGRPRGAVLTRANLAANLAQSRAGRLTVGPDDRVLVLVPFAHVYALNVGLGVPLSVGAAVVVMDRPDPDAALDAVATYDVNVVLASPSTYVAWTTSERLAGTGLGRVRLAVSGAAPLGVQTIERFRELTGLRIEEGYGLTEAGPSVASTLMSTDAPAGSVGLPLPGVELRLVDEASQPVVTGDVGEIRVKGPNVFAGYFNDPQATRAAFDDEGWLRTGDVGTFDEDGMLYLVDRLRDLVIVDGFSVFPGEVERVLTDDPRVASAGVVGVPHPVTGEALTAYVVPAAGADIDVSDLHDRCREALAPYKRPQRIELVDSLPYTATGKVRRMVLRTGEAREESWSA